MAIPVFSQIVAMGQVTLPGAPTIYNFDYLLGHDGFIGIKTGSDSAAGGCFLFEVQRPVGTQSVSLVGVVLGQQGTSDIEQVLEVTDILVDAAFASLKSVPVVSAGGVVGRVVAPWGASVPVGSRTPVTIVGLPGEVVAKTVTLPGLSSTHSVKGAPVGILRIGSGREAQVVMLQLSADLPGPSVLWRLTRL